MVHTITMENLSHWLKHTISFIPSPFQSRTELVSRSFLCDDLKCGGVKAIVL